MNLFGNKQKILLIILVIVLAIGALIYFGFLKKDFISSLKIPIALEDVSLFDKQIKSIKLDTKILDSYLFKSLKVYGSFPIEVKSAGRNNPFIPF